jgi:hypothetical protein
MEQIKIKITKEQSDLFKHTGNIVSSSNGNVYMNIPYWVKQTEEEHVYECLTVEQLPSEFLKLNTIKQAAVEWFRQELLKRDTDISIRELFEQAKEMEKQQQGYSEEDMIEFAFDTYYYISGIMRVPFNQLSENKLHVFYNFEQFKK